MATRVKGDAAARSVARKSKQCGPKSDARGGKKSLAGAGTATGAGKGRVRTLVLGEIDLKEARAALEEAKAGGSISWEVAKRELGI